MAKKADAVFEGGGVKGIGLVGAVSVIEKAGYEFQNLVGTSAGAIVASLLAAGYTSDQLKVEMQKLDYNNFKDEGFLDRLGIIGKGLSLGFEYGIYEGDFFEDWLEGLLQRKNCTKFRDLHTSFDNELYRYKLQVIAADISDRRLLVLPGDFKKLGYDPDEFSVSRAIRMSMSIPVFFEPVRLPDASGREHLIVDGGLLSNYPIWLLDDRTSDPPWPTFGFKLIEPNERTIKAGSRNTIKNPVNYFKALVGTMLDAHDKYHVSNKTGDYNRTIGINTVVNIGGEKKEIKSTDFDISHEESEVLYKNGQAAAKRFLDTWNFDLWKKEYRT